MEGESIEPKSGLPYEFSPFFFQTKTVLKQIGIDLGPLPEEIQKNILKFLTPRIFDRGSIKELPAIDSLPKLQEDNGLSYENSPLKGITVLTSAMVPLLVRNNWQIWKMIDIKNLYGANQVSYLMGDRLIRQVLMTILESFKGIRQFMIARFGGDEFLLLSQKDLSENELNECWEKAKQGLANQRCYFKRNGQEALDKLQIEEKQYVSSLIDQQLHHPDDDLSGRRGQLENLHPEIVSLLTNVHQLPEQQQMNIISLIEKILYDPLLFEEASLLRKKGIQVYKDPIDLFIHLRQQPGRFKVVKIEYPGLLKKVNDKIGYGYLAGNTLIKYLFRHLIDRYQNVCAVFRQGGDFYLITSEEEVEKPSDEEKPPSFICLIKNEKGYEVIKVNNHNIENYKGELVLPIMELKSDLSLTVEGLKYSVDDQSFENETEVSDYLREKLSNNIKESLQSEIINILNKLTTFLNPSSPNDLPASIKNIIEYLSYLFNPYDEKRGLNRLINMGVSPDDINDLKTFYEELPNKKGAYQLKDESEIYKQFPQRLLEIIPQSLSS